MYDFCNNGKTTSILKMTDLYIYLPGEESMRGNIVCLHKPICGGNRFSMKLPNFGSGDRGKWNLLRRQVGELENSNKPGVEKWEVQGPRRPLFVWRWMISSVIPALGS